MNEQNHDRKGRGHNGEGTKKYPADRNFAPAGDRKPYEKKASDNRPRSNQSYEKKSYSDKSFDRKPYEKKPYDKKPYGDRPRGDRPYSKKSFSDNATEAGRRDRYDRYEDEEDGNTPDPEAAGLVIGRNAVRELLRSDRTVDKLLVRRGDREGSIVVLVAEAVEKDIPVVEVDKAKLDSLAGFIPHQGVIAMVAQKDYCTVEDILAIAEERGEKPFIVIADGITDPYNLGALIRCAEGCGAHGLIIPRRRAVGLTALVAKSSAGAMEHLAVAKVANIHQTILDLQKAGVWVYAAEAGGAAHYNTDFSGPCALVMGSEGDGVSRVVKDACDAVVSIPMYGHVNSFNVSTAASVILCEIARAHHKND